MKLGMGGECGGNLTYGEIRIRITADFLVINNARKERVE